MSEPVAAVSLLEPVAASTVVEATGGTAPEAAEPRTLAGALALLAADPDRLPLAGCTDLMVAEPLARAGRARVLDLTAIPELRGIRMVRTVPSSDEAVEIGAATTFTEIGADATIAAQFPALAAAAAEIGGWQIQNRATLGGNAANASPAGDSLPVLLALDATAILESAVGRREVTYDQFHLGYRKTALRPGELLVAIRLPVPAPGTHQAFRKVGPRKVQAISKVVVALRARVEGGRIADLRIAAGSVAATPVRLAAAEHAALGRPPDAETAAAAGRAAASEVTPIDDVRSSAEYRRFVLGRVVRRLLLGLPPE